MTILRSFVIYCERSLLKNEKILKKQIFDNFEKNVQGSKRLKSIFSSQRAIKINSQDFQKNNHEIITNHIKNEILSTLRNKSFKRNKTYSYRVSKKKIFNNNDQVTKALNYIPEFHQYFKTNLKKSLSTSKDKKKTWIVKTKNISSKVSNFKSTNPLLSNSSIKD